ncbi:glycosyltransferase family 32 protein [Cypionkella sp.]|uniref:glycosyltransferase family 32 protein n=1 Tax=Cypionkella sp. TaxID=2811411 RepID=UPI002AB9D020|nr:glycosyltransferase [Cypionkella sp.]MDZ4395368.1 glycosyltransferase [Cypionkella sp.]
MSAKQRMNDGIAAARVLVATGDFDAATAVLDGLAADREIAALPAQTALGLPRRLHAARLHLAKAQGDAVARAGYQFHLVPAPELLAPLFRFSAAERQAIVAANRVAVPRVIHQIWIGTLPVPASVAAWRHHAGLHGYRYRLWQEADLASLGLPDQPVYAAMLARGDYPGAVDVARYAILAAEGGIYLDCDWYPARDDISFHDLVPLIGLTAWAESVPRQTGLGGLLLGNSFIATPPDHPALHRLNARLGQALDLLPEAPAWWSTGPLVFTLAARGGAVSVAPQTLIAGALPDRAAVAEVEALRARALAMEDGLLIAWKSW